MQKQWIEKNSLFKKTATFKTKNATQILSLEKVLSKRGIEFHFCIHTGTIRKLIHIAVEIG